MRPARPRRGGRRRSVCGPAGVGVGVEVAEADDADADGDGLVGAGGERHRGAPGEERPTREGRGERAGRGRWIRASSACIGSPGSVAPGYDAAMLALEVPPGIAALPRFPLLDGPSPLQPLPRFSAALGGGVEVWIKREDLLPLAFGGNKLRNLEFLVGAALAEGADTLVTSRPALVEPLPADGRRRRAGRPRRPPRPERPAARRARRRTSASTRMLGATIHVATTDERVGARGARRSGSPLDLRRAGKRPFVVGVGGSGPVGAAGQVLAGTRGCSARRGPPASSRRRSCCHRRPAGPMPASSSGRGWRRSAARVVGVAVAAPSDELAADDRRPARGPRAADRRDRRPGRDRADRRRARPGLRRPRPPTPTRRRAPRPDRGHLRRPDLHGQGAGRARGPRPRRPARAGRSSSGTPAGRRPCSSACQGTEPDRPTRSTARQASRSLIRPAVWSTAPE